MEINKAVEILDRYNRWRRGSEIPQPNPTEIGTAIDLVVLELKIKNAQEFYCMELSIRKENDSKCSKQCDYCKNINL